MAAVTRPQGEDSELGVHPPRGRHPCIPWAAGSQLQRVPSRHSYTTHVRERQNEWVSEPSSRRRPAHQCPCDLSSRVAHRDGILVSFAVNATSNRPAHECPCDPSSRVAHRDGILVSFAVNATSNQILASGSTVSGPGQRKPPLLFSPLCRLKGGGSENLKEGGVGPLSGCVKQSPAPPLDRKRVRNHGACSVGHTTRGLSVSTESTQTNETPRQSF